MYVGGFKSWLSQWNNFCKSKEMEYHEAHEDHEEIRKRTALTHETSLVLTLSFLYEMNQVLDIMIVNPNPLDGGEPGWW
jgi:hypothetical protein